MNDTELDDLLEAWKTPAVPGSLRNRLLSRYRKPEKAGRWVRILQWIGVVAPKPRTLIFTASTLATVLLLFAGVQAFSQIHGSLKPAYTVTSRLTRYADDGSSSIESYTTSYNQNMRERTLLTIIPGHPVESHVHILMDLFHNLAFDLFSSSSAHAEQEALDSASAFVKSGCTNGNVTGHETILGYATVAVQLPHRDHQRFTKWMAPELGCFALRVRVEKQLANGTFRQITERQATRVNVSQ